MRDGPRKQKQHLTDVELLRLAASTFGRLGGLKGGKARAEKLSPERRSEIAQEAARKRWATKKGKRND